MIILIAYIGGLFTILNPCILPIVPFVLSRAGKKFSHNGLPLLIGMALTFTLVATVAVVSSEWITHANQIGRWIALSLLGLFSLALLMPQLNNWIMRPIVSAGNRINNAASSRSGITGSLLIGIATGLLWAPCAGPILGLIMSGAMLQGASVNTSLLLLAYGAGAATSLGVVLLISRPLFKTIMTKLPYINGLRRGLGAVMFSAVLIIAFGLDTGFLARISSGSTNFIEARILNKLTVQAAEIVTPPQLRLNKLGAMPQLSGAVEWFNSPALSKEALRGKVVLIKFWTYACINCIRTMPYAIEWDKQYRDQGLVVIGVHTPEFAFEKNRNNIQKAMRRFSVDFPVAVDNNYSIWRAFNNRYWPAIYIIDAAGQIRYSKFGEGDYDYSEQVIQQLLHEAGQTSVQAAAQPFTPTGVHRAADYKHLKSGETYIGYAQAGRMASTPSVRADQTQTYATAQNLSLNSWGLTGDWQVAAESAQVKTAGAKLNMRFQARDVNLVLGAEIPEQTLRFRVLIDGKPPGVDHGLDINAQGEGAIIDTRLYQLIRQKGAIKAKTIEIEFIDAGAQAYVFTFG